MSASEYRSMPEYPLWAYAWPATVDRKVAPALDLYVSSRSAHLLVEVYSALDFSFAAWDTFQDVDKLRLLWRIDDAEWTAIGPDDDSAGCVRWKRHPVPLPEGMRGAFVARVTALDGKARPAIIVPFCVRDSRQRRPILFSFSTFTEQAYNAWGGRSYYYSLDRTGANHGPEFSDVVSLRRPLYNWRECGRACRPIYPECEIKFLQWLAGETVVEKTGEEHALIDDVDCCTNVDIDRDPDLFTGVKLLVTAGQHEYWTQVMYDRIHGFVRAGGNYANLGGNTCWRRVSLDAAGVMRIVQDPLSAWYFIYSETKDYHLIGVSSYWGAVSVEDHPGFPPSLIKRRYHVADPESWVFARLGAGVGEPFGVSANPDLAPIGADTDAARLTNDAIPRLDFGGEWPMDAKVSLCAWADLRGIGAYEARESEVERSLRATMVTRGIGRGEVFSAGTVNWAHALEPTRLKERWGQGDIVKDVGFPSMITRNVILKLGGIS